MIKIKQGVVSLAIYLILPSCFVGCNAESSKTNSREQKQIEMVKNGNAEICLNGKVLDQDDMGISGINIRGQIMKYVLDPRTQFHSMSEFKEKTDKNGNFSVKGKGYRLFIDLCKQGEYEPIEDGKARKDFDIQTGWIPDPKNVFIYRFRKKGKGTFLLDQGITCLSFSRLESGSQKGSDLIMGMPIREKELVNPEVNGIPLFSDLTTQASFDVITGKWKIILRPGGKNGGVFFSPSLLYLAPVDGYQREYVLDPDIFMKTYGLKAHSEQYKQIYCYLRSRDPVIYTRIAIDSIQVDDSCIELGLYGLVTNPYGDRNLEDAGPLPYDVYKRLRQEITTAYRSGGSSRPLTPDIPFLLGASSKKWFGKW